jgi:CheY-like chemotaxis protein
MMRPILLLVEDSVLDAELFRRGLENPSLDLDLRVVHSGTDALRLLRPDPADASTTGLVPKVIFLDLQMPGMDGFAVLAAIREDPALRELPVIIFSSSSQERDIRECCRRGANSYIQKPMDPEAFREMVRTLAHYWTRCNLTPSASQG